MTEINLFETLWDIFVLLTEFSQTVWDWFFTELTLGGWDLLVFEIPELSFTPIGVLGTAIIPILLTFSLIKKIFPIA